MTKQNENRPRYKKTKVGWIPEEWDCVRLSKICTKIGSGITPKGGRDTYVDKGIPFIRSQNVQDGYFTSRGIAYITDEQHEKMSGSAVLQGDVLYNITGASIGRACCFPINIPQANVNQHVCILRTNPTTYAYFLNIQLNSSIGKKQLYANQAGGGREGLNFENLGAYTVPLPPLPEQKKIAEILSTWDRVIEKTGKLIEKCELRKKGLMQRLFNHETHETHEKNKRWEKVKIGDVLKEVKRPLKMSDDESYQLVTVKRRFGGVESRSILYGKEILVKNQYYLKEGDFLISKRQIVHGACNLVPKRLEGAIVSNEYLVFAPKKCIDIKYFNRLVQLPKMQHKFYLSSIGVHIEKMLFKYEWWKKEKILFPPIEEQKKIAKILDAADNEINTLKSKLEALKEQKKGLMQKLLTGEVRTTTDGHR